MPFTIEQKTSLKLIDEAKKPIAFAPGELEAIREQEIIRRQRFKEDKELRKAFFVKKILQGRIKVAVTYSIGLDGVSVDAVEVVEVPNGWEVSVVPEFEIQEHEDCEFIDE